MLLTLRTYTHIHVAMFQELMEFASKKIMFVKEAPHEWLFRRCAVIVHHGGAGTTAAALRSGEIAFLCGQPCDRRQHQDLDRGK